LPRVLINQIIHGYRQGHRKLHATITPTHDDEVVLDSLSDLSGFLPVGAKLRPYYTGYPLPSGTFYVFAKTWLDDAAGRTGCVITQSLLLGRSDLTGIADFEAVAKLFTDDPQAAKLSSPRPLFWEAPSFRPVPLNNRASATAIAKDFFEGSGRPLLVREGDMDEADLFRFWSCMWPELKFTFKFCTCALQPLYLGEKSFDILVVPAWVTSAFSESGRWSKPSAANTPRIWVEAYLGEMEGKRAGLYKLYAVGRRLGALSDSPLALPIVAELVRIASDIRAPYRTSLLGLSALEKLSANTPVANRFRVRLARRVLNAIPALPTTERLSAIEQLDTVLGSLLRLQQMGEFTNRYRESVSEVLAQSETDLERALSDIDTPNPGLSTIFVQGLVIALEQLPEISDGVTALIARQTVARVLIRAHPVAVRLVYRSMAREQSCSNLVLSILTILTQIPPEQKLEGLGTLQAELVSASDVDAIAVLYQSVEGGDGRRLLILLQQQTRNSDRGLISLLAQRLLVVAGTLVEDWATHAWTPDARLVAAVVAFSMASTAEALRSLLPEHCQLDAAHVALLDFYLDRDDSQVTSADAIMFFCSRRDILERLLQSSQAGDEAADSVLYRLCSRIPSAEILSATQLSDTADEWVRRRGSAALLANTLIAAIQGKISGTEAANSADRWISTRTAQNTLSMLDAERLNAAFRSVSEESAINALRLLNTLRGEFWRVQGDVVVFSAGQALLVGGRAGAVIAEYRKLMDVSDAPHSVAVCIRAQVLYYALEHPELPLSELVALTFHPVHEFICYSRAEHDQKYRAVYSVFPSREWDKGMLLRRRLVAAFMNSRWPRLDLLKAARNPTAFRQLLPLIRDNRGGSAFLSELSLDLGQAGSAGAPFAAELVSFLQPGLLKRVQDWLL
jgi:hypothetical protein